MKKLQTVLMTLALIAGSLFTQAQSANQDPVKLSFDLKVA
jgi:hypothetical protein